MSSSGTQNANSLRIAVIGSGLSALGAIKALVKQGIKPTVIDVGERLDPDRESRAARLANVCPDQWTAADREWLNLNPTVKSGSGIPKKLIFGSDYFYGSSKREAPIQPEGNLPPFSYALGGLSAGWGAAVLPPQACDLQDWPVSAEELTRYCEIVLQGLPYSAVDDGLSTDFDILSLKPVPIRLGRAGKTLLGWLAAKAKVEKGKFLFGQARLLVNGGNGSEPSACRYCGQCSSGCAYGAIYKAGDEILSLHRQGLIDYMPGQLVDRMEEGSDEARIFIRELNGGNTEMRFDRVFLAAGAVNSTRIVMKSLGMFDYPLDLKTRGGYVLPVLSLRGLPRDWPSCNTQPEVFFEFRGKNQHWVHAQVALENELLVQKLGGGKPGNVVLSKFREFLLKRLFIVLVNYHSDHSGAYELRLKKGQGIEQEDYLHSVHKKSLPQAPVLYSSATTLLSNLLKLACVPLFPFAKLNSGSYHVGGTLPMKTLPHAWNETDILGRPNGWKRIHVVDTSVFPSLPGTTVGLLTMANAFRIAETAFHSS